MKAVKVYLKDAQKIKNELLKFDVINKDYAIKKDEKYIYYPIKKNIEGYLIINKKFYKREVFKNLKDYLKNIISSNELEKINNSFEIIGDIAIIEISEELESKKKLIAEGLLKTNKNVRIVAMKKSGREGVYRLQEYEILNGKGNLETLYKENGLIFKLDISKLYFSSKLSTDRMRIAKLIKENENVLVMFSGIGIYPIIISKYSKAKEIYGIEINPYACKYAEENIKLNKIENVKLYCGDTKEVIPNLLIKFDRIIMPLPKTAEEYLESAFSVLKENGSVYLYIFIDEDKIEKKNKELNKKYKVINIVKCGQTKPRSYRCCVKLKRK